MFSDFGKLQNRFPYSKCILFMKSKNLISISIELYGDCLNNIDNKERKFEIAFISNSLFNTL